MMSPRLVLPVLVTVLVGLGMPGPQQKAVSAQMVLAGTFNAVYGGGMPEQGGPPQRRYMLSSGNLHWNLTVTDAVLNAAGGALFLNGKTVEVTGVETSVGKITVDAIRLTGASAALALPLADPMAIAGSQKFRTILCKFADVPDEPQNLAFFDGLMSNTKPGANHYWRELSYDFINLDGSSQHNWVTLPQNRNQYFDNDDTSDDIQLGELATDCANAHDATVDFSDALGINFIFNASIGCCAWGGGISNTLDGKSGFSATWMPPWSWGTTSHGVLGQEMGHSFGLPHEGCFGTASPYDSQWDVQSAARQVHTNADYKDMLGWIVDDQKYVATTDPNQIVEIRRLALPDLAPHANSYLMAKIPLPGGPATQYYTVEVRKFAGYDQSPQSVPLEGVLIHFVDTTLGDKRAQVVGTPCNGAGAQWVPGELFQDEANGITIAVLSETSDGFEIAINPDSDVTVSKTATPSPAVAGGLISYNITVRNLGPGPATGIVVKDTLPAGVTYDENTLGPGACSAVGQVVTCNISGSLAPGATKTFSIIGRISPSIANGSGGTTTITNLVNVVAAQDADATATNNNFSLTTLVVTETDLRIGKECKPDSPAPAGTSATCTITVDNLGPSDALNVVVTDTHVSNGSFTITSAVASPGGPCGIAGGTVTCNLGTEPAGGRTTITVVLTSNEAVDVNDTACVASSTPEASYENDCASDGVSFFSKADLSLTKTAAPAIVVAGETITYTITVTNAGPSIATGVVVRDNLPADVTMVSASIALPAVGQCIPGTPGNPALPLTCSIGNVANGASAVVTVVTRVKASTPNGTILSNGATVAGTSSDPDNSNNSQSALSNVVTRADLAIVKTADAATYKPNTTVTYRVRTTNNGSSDAQNVTVVDTLPDIKQAVYTSNTNPGGCIFQAPKSLTCNVGTMPAGASHEFFIKLTVKGAQGSIANRVDVSSTTTDPVAGNNTSTVSVTIKGGK